MGKKHDDDEYVPSRYKKDDALRDLDELESMSSFVLPSSIAKIEEGKKKETVEIEDDDEYETVADAFVDRLENFFIRFLRGSNAGGLVSPKPFYRMDGIEILRN